MRGKALTRNNGDTIILLFILMLGTVLRIYRLQDIPFTHDEFSALFRTRFDSFADLINQGVKIDTHPAGIQVFMYYWVKLFGEGEVAVKIPFIFFGILSVYLIYRLGREWFNPLVGLISAACFSCMEYTIMYSQIARPYISGLMLVLIMVLAWTRYLFRPGKHQYMHLGVLVLTGSLCTYNLFYRSRFKEFIVETDRTLQEYGRNNCLVIMDSHKKISEHYYQTLGIDFDHVHYDDLKDNREFAAVLERSTCGYLSLSCDSESDLVLPNIVRIYYPRMLKKIDYYGGNYYVFSRDTASDEEYFFRFQNDFNGEAKYWSEGMKEKYSDTIGFGNQNSYLMDGQQEFSPTFNRPLRSILVHRNDLIDISLAVRDLDSINSSLLVVVLNDGEKQISWTASKFEWYKPPGSDWYRVYHTFRPAVERNLKPLEVHVYLWNKDLQRYYIDDFRIDTRTGNHELFGLLERI